MEYSRAWKRRYRKSSDKNRAGSCDKAAVRHGDGRQGRRGLGTDRACEVWGQRKLAHGSSAHTDLAHALCCLKACDTLLRGEASPYIKILKLILTNTE